VSVGVRVSDHFELSPSISALFLVAPRVPRWDSTMGIDASTDGYAVFDADSATGSVVFAVTAGLTARYGF
jgi:hypothetical protein